MRINLAAMALAALCVLVGVPQSVPAKDATPSTKAASAVVVSTIRPPPIESQLTTHTTYRNREGGTVHSPSNTTIGLVPAGSSAHCRDGTFSFSRHRSGTCSHHGGVAQWL